MCIADMNMAIQTLPRRRRYIYSNNYQKFSAWRFIYVVLSTKSLIITSDFLAAQHIMTDYSHVIIETESTTYVIKRRADIKIIIINKSNLVCNISSKFAASEKFHI